MRALESSVIAVPQHEDRSAADQWAAEKKEGGFVIPAKAGIARPSPKRTDGKKK